ncbi:MAG: hypothetical protein ACOZDY_17870 [Pseudomonadota bacterium]
MPELIVKSPAEFSNLEIGYFIACVRAGGEVSIQGLVERIRNAAALVFAKIDGGLVGVAALKRPLASYRRSVSSRCGIPLSAAEFPFELGWALVAGFCSQCCPTRQSTGRCAMKPRSACYFER